MHHRVGKNLVCVGIVKVSLLAFDFVSTLDPSFDN